MVGHSSRAWVLLLTTSGSPGQLGFPTVDIILLAWALMLACALSPEPMTLNPEPYTPNLTPLSRVLRRWSSVMGTGALGWRATWHGTPTPTSSTLRSRRGPTALPLARAPGTGLPLLAIPLPALSVIHAQPGQGLHKRAGRSVPLCRGHWQRRRLCAWHSWSWYDAIRP